MWSDDFLRRVAGRGSMSPPGAGVASCDGVVAEAVAGPPDGGDVATSLRTAAVAGVVAGVVTGAEVARRPWSAAL